MSIMPPASNQARIPFCDLRVTDPEMLQRLLARVSTVLSHGRLLLGPEVEQLEAAVATYCEKRFCVGVGSGTDAIYVGLKALGIGPGDEVIVPALSWIATANGVRMTGATPVFADIKEDLNIDPDSVLSLISPRTRAVMPVHYTGLLCEIEKLRELCKPRGITLVEDASQSFGATRHGARAGSFGDMACISMNPMKVFAACGEAGVVLTDDPTIVDKLKALRYNGMINRELCNEPGLNCRIDTLQAAILLERLPLVDGIIERRREIAALYRSLIKAPVVHPLEPKGDRHAFYVYTVSAPRRKELSDHLERYNIEAKVRDPILMPDQPAYRVGVQGTFPRAQRLVGELISLPCFEGLSDLQVRRVCEVVNDFYHAASVSQ
jgi:dTDP-4-amino-4,6-dideoxygalactose transaminase